MDKYRRVRERVQDGIQQDRDGALVNYQFLVSPLASWDDLVTTHDPEYIERFLRGNQTELELRNVGFPWSLDGVKRSLSSTGGTVAAACAVCEAQLHLLRCNLKQNDHNHPIWAAHLAGGTHQAFHDRG